MEVLDLTFVTILERIFDKGNIGYNLGKNSRYVNLGNNLVRILGKEILVTVLV